MTESTPPRPTVTLSSLRKRRWIMLGASLPVVIFGLYWAFHMLGLAPIAQIAINAFDDEDYTTSAEVSSTLLGNNVFEPYLPYFNRGDAFAGQQNYGPAVDDFEIALELAPQERQCDVRLNLALGWERFGDAYVEAGFYQGAVNLYAASQAVLDAAGPECDPPENQEQLQESKDRVSEKKEQAEELRDAEPPPEGGEDGEDGQSEQEQQLEELQEQQEQAAQEKADDEAEQRSEENGGYYTDEPW